jgi:hypothetical protein
MFAGGGKRDGLTQSAKDAAAFSATQTRSQDSFCADEKCEKAKYDEHLRDCADTQGGNRQEGDGLDIPEFLRRVA